MDSILVVVHRTFSFVDLLEDQHNEKYQVYTVYLLEKTSFEDPHLYWMTSKMWMSRSMNLSSNEMKMNFVSKNKTMFITFIEKNLSVDETIEHKRKLDEHQSEIMCSYSQEIAVNMILTINADGKNNAKKKKRKKKTECSTSILSTTIILSMFILY